MQMKSTVFIGVIHTSPENPLPQQVGVLRVASPPKMRFASASWPKFLLILKQKRERMVFSTYDREIIWMVASRNAAVGVCCLNGFTPRSRSEYFKTAVQAQETITLLHGICCMRISKDLLKSLLFEQFVPWESTRVQFMQ